MLTKIKMQNKYKCEAKITNWTDLKNIKYNVCEKKAPFICIHCNKHFCIDDMYLMCDICYEYLTCYPCGIPYMKNNGSYYLNSKQYCIRCKQNEC